MGPPRLTKIGKYEVIEIVGRGGMGVVYKAVDPAIGRLVAIKMMTGGFGDDPELLNVSTAKRNPPEACSIPTSSRSMNWETSKVSPIW